jgi:hypothetical protein
LWWERRQSTTIFAAPLLILGSTDRLRDHPAGEFSAGLRDVG